jgi:hypothetical protein
LPQTLCPVWVKVWQLVEVGVVWAKDDAAPHAIGVSNPRPNPNVTSIEDRIRFIITDSFIVQAALRPAVSKVLTCEA